MLWEIDVPESRAINASPGDDAKKYNTVHGVTNYYFHNCGTALSAFIVWDMDVPEPLAANSYPGGESRNVCAAECI